MKTEGVEFREALEIWPIGLESRWNVRKPARKGLRPGSFDERTLYRAMAWAEKQYHHCLMESLEAEPARRYLEERGSRPKASKNSASVFPPPERDWILRKPRQE